MVSAAANIVEFEQALRLLDATPVAVVAGPEELSLLAARGRILRAPIYADRDQPPFDRATRDGFAVRAAEFGAQELTVIGTVRAGEMWGGAALSTGQAIEIMTGAPMPHGADAVAMIEHVERGGEHLKALPGRSLSAGDNVVAQGSEARAGEIVVAAGTAIQAAEIAMAAACGAARVQVYRRVKVAIVATGDELVEMDAQPEARQIRNSNSYALAAMIEAAGGEAVRLPITPDRREAVAASLRIAREADLIVLSGGVSMGEYDLVEEMLLAAGAEFLFTGVKMQPGKPVVFGSLSDGKFFFGLPGNPISTQVTFHCFVEPFLRRMAGEVGAAPRWGLATLVEPASGKPGLTRLLPGRMDGTSVRIVGWQGSGDLAANARANCYVELKDSREAFAAGELVRVLLR